MDKTEIDHRIREKLLEILETNENIDDNFQLQSNGLDSIKTIRLIVEIETMFDITIDDDDLVTEKYSTFLKIKEMVHSKL